MKEERMVQEKSQNSICSKNTLEKMLNKYILDEQKLKEYSDKIPLIKNAERSSSEWSVHREKQWVVFLYLLSHQNMWMNVYSSFIQNS